MLLTTPAILLSAFSYGAQALHAPPQQTVLDKANANAHLDLTHDLFAFHKNLTSIESISGNEKAVGEWLVSSLESQGYTVEKQILSKDPMRFNVLAWPGANRETDLLLSSHIDTVSSSLHSPMLYPAE